MDVRRNTIYTSDLEQAPESIIIVDIDGTLVPDKSNHIPKTARDLISTLKKIHCVWVCSNGDPVRTQFLAEELDVPVLPVHKPHGVLPAIPKLDKGVVVVGDKYLTDGLFAQRIRARFVKVDHVTSFTDSLSIKLSYVIDDVVWFVICAAQLMRPFQWVKNMLIYAPLFFAHEAFSSKLVEVSVGVFVFSLSASVVYIFNDIHDRAVDALHPTKKHRPLASGQVSEKQAYMLIAMLLSIVCIGIFFVPTIILPVVFYMGVNIAYSLWFKHVAIIDILLVASFYVLRVVVGGVVAHVPLSPWILLCVFFGALFVVIGKRRSEYAREDRRGVLEEYSEKTLDYMVAVSAAVAIISYGIYTVIGYDSPYLVYSTFFVVLALFRVLNHIYMHPEQGESPERLVFKDPVVLGAFIGWVVYVFIVFYLV